MTPEEIIKLNVSEDSLTQGLHYALLSWSSTFNRMGKADPYERLQKIMFGVAAELEFENYLNSKAIEYDLSGRTRWYEVDRYDLSINGVPVDVKSNLIDFSSPYIIRRIKNTSIEKWLLKCQALVPLNQFNCKSSRRVKKCYVFPFVGGFFDTMNGGRPYVHTFWDYKWLKKVDYLKDKREGQIRIKFSNPSVGASIRIYGTSRPKHYCIEEVNLSKDEIITENSFFQVFSILWTGKNEPKGTLTIEWLHCDMMEIIKPEFSFVLGRSKGEAPLENNWQSMQMFDYSIYIAGWIHEDDMRVIGKLYPRFCKEIEQYPDTIVPNWGCDVRDLNPLNNIDEL